MQLRTIHVITGLGVGGAETMLAKLLEAEVASARSSTIEVICLGGPGPMADRIRATGIPLTCINMGPGGSTGTVEGLRILASRLRAGRPDVIQSWMYHADLLSGVVACLTIPRAARIWSIRASSLPQPISLRTRLIIRTCAFLSHFIPQRIISCSQTAAALHERMGYDAKRIVVIPNGFDLRSFVPDDHAKAQVTAELGLPETTPLIGCVARFDPQKDFATLLRSFSVVAQRHATATLVLAGRGCDETNQELLGMISAPLRSRVKLLGLRTDVPRLTAAFDVAVLTSAYGEGFPNVLGEALACGVPCVATDVGDSREIAGAEGVIAPIGDADAIGAGLLKLLEQPLGERRAAREQMRERALRDYDLQTIARRYWAVQEAVGGRS